MARVFSRTAHRAGRTRAPRLRFEHLETRDCPAAPCLSSFNVTRLQGHAIQVSGTIVDESPTTAQVRLSGVATGIFVPNALGAFSGQTTTTGFGQIGARAYDAEGYMSRIWLVDYQNLPPSLTYQVTQSGPAQFTISGVVTDEDPNLATVFVTGVAAGSVAPDINGNFSFSFTSGVLGAMHIRAVDQGGLSSGLQDFQLPNAAPVITQFFATQQGNAWILQGTVVDEMPAGLVVTFHSGIALIDGRTATVDSTGHFSAVFYLKHNDTGIVSAFTQDWFGAGSNTAYTYIG
jgi:hypothetical protein